VAGLSKEGLVRYAAVIVAGQCGCRRDESEGNNSLNRMMGWWSEENAVIRAKRIHRHIVCKKLLKDGHILA
jgi:hypothetical protein